MAGRPVIGATPARDPGPPQVARLSVVLPCRNEAALIYASIQRTAEVLAALTPEIVVVDDGSTDATLAEAARAEDDGWPVVAVRQLTNRGKGAALAAGCAHASCDLVAFLDADLEIAPEYVAAFVATLEETGADVVVGVRSEGDSRFPIVRRVLSRAYRLLVRFLFGLDLADTQAGIKLFRRETLEVCLPHVRATRFAFDVELLALCERFGFRIEQVPVALEFRRSGPLARMGANSIVEMAAETFAVWARLSGVVWLEPGRATQGWMLLLALGLFGAGLALGALLAGAGIDARLGAGFAAAALLAAIALVQLNKQLVRAFARAERTGLWNRRRPGSGNGPPPHEEGAA
jgi:glycosyltransferase involved in cell wall biosynthesis